MFKLYRVLHAHKALPTIEVNRRTPLLIYNPMEFWIEACYIKGYYLYLFCFKVYGTSHLRNPRQKK